MKKKPVVVDADFANAGRALKRAAAKARQLSEETGTPFYVFKDGRVVDLNPQNGGGRSRRKRIKRK